MKPLPFHRIRLEPRDMAAFLVQTVPPAPPAGAGGTVKVQIVVAKDGSVMEANAVEGDEELGRAAVEAVKQWKYRVVMVNGQPVEALSSVDVDVR